MSQAQQKQLKAKSPFEWKFANGGTAGSFVSKGYNPPSSEKLHTDVPFDWAEGKNGEKKEGKRKKASRPIEPEKGDATSTFAIRMLSG